MMMKKMMMKKNDVFNKYIKTRDHYYRNMKEALSKKEYQKASELLWGSVTQSIKALASLSGIKIRSHNKFKSFTRRIAKDIEDWEYHDLFLSLQHLHQNFYDEHVDPLDFPIYHEKARNFIKKNDKLIRQKLDKMRI